MLVPPERLLRQSLIEDAIEMGCAELSFGRTAAESKAGLGAVAYPSHVWLRHRVPVVREIFSRVLPDAAPRRRPFKESAGEQDATSETSTR